MFLVWTDDVMVGVDILDIQHKKLFETLNTLVNAIEVHSGQKEVERVIGFLDNYVVEHFGTEEKMMKEVSCPRMDEHIEQHKVFIDSLDEVKGYYTSEGTTEDLSLMLRNNLCHWLVSHIMMVDKEMGLFLKDKGV